MTRLLCGMFACFVFCFIAPGLVVYYCNLDRFDEAKWRGRLEAVQQASEEAEKIMQQSKELEKKWGNDSESVSDVKDVRVAELQLQQRALEGQLLLNQLGGVLLKGAIRGSELQVRGVLTISSYIALALAAMWVAGLFFVTQRFGTNWWATRKIAQSLLRDMGMRTKDLPAQDLPRIFDALGTCRWHLAQMKRLLHTKQFPTHINGNIGVIRDVSMRLHDMLDDSFIPSIAPDIAGMRELQRQQIDSDRRVTKKHLALQTEAKALEEKGAARAREELASDRIELEARRVQLHDERQKMEAERHQLSENGHNLREEADALQKLRLEVEKMQLSAARDRSYCEQQLQDASQALAQAEAWGTRIDAGVAFIQEGLAKIDPEGSHPMHADTVQALAKALGIAKSLRQDDPSPVI